MFIMISPHHPPVALLFQAALCLVASAATNKSVDDQDPHFHYSVEGWIPITGSMDEGGGHMLSNTSGSSANITYTCAYLLKVDSDI
jgi:hypothetical protein